MVEHFPRNIQRAWPIRASTQQEVVMIWSIAIIAAVFFGCVTSIVAGEKHRNALGWFAIGALWPLLGLVLAIVLPPNQTPET
jgi:peptidoglycan/LPS O-acetylase OafA/YrhL